MDAQKVSTGNPTGGAISVAPLSTTLPTDTTTALNAAFKSLGYISDAGVANGNSPATTDIKSWGGNTVASAQTDKPDTFKFKLIETNEDVLKLVYGSTNVTGTLAAGLTVKANSKPAEYNSFVIEMIMKDSKLKRIVIPSAKITAISDIIYASNAVVGYEITITAVPDTSGNTHYEYIK